MPLQFIKAKSNRYYYYYYYYSETSGNIFKLKALDKIKIKILNRKNSSFSPTDRAVTSNFIPMEDFLK
jgi:hypothetical protein